MQNTSGDGVAVCERRFQDLWKNAGSTCGGKHAIVVFTGLETRYAESQRRYHTMAHIQHCLSQVDKLPQDYPDRNAVEIAIWFHDVIYQLGDSDNETNSTRWFVEQAQNDLSPDFIEQVCRLILATRHRFPVERLDEQYVVDIDLSGFGLPWNEFVRDSESVRAEMTNQTDEDFLTAHRAFLSMLLSRESIYFTPLFRDLYESQARNNIQTRLKAIGD